MDHYETLGVSRNATSADIKRAYRRLAVLYHPDKNSDPAAENFFKEVNVAYDVLSDPVKKRAYDLRRETMFEPQHPPAPKHRDPAYRNPNRPKPKYKGERQRILEMMAEYLPIVQRATWVCLIISSILIIDFALPHRNTDDSVEEAYLVKRSRSRYATTFWHFTTIKGKQFEVEQDYSKFLQPGASINIESSLLFNVPRYINTISETIRISKTLYGNFFFAPLTLFVVAFCGYLFRNKIETSFNLGIGCILLLGLNGILVLLL